MRILPRLVLGLNILLLFLPHTVPFRAVTTSSLEELSPYVSSVPSLFPWFPLLREIDYAGVEDLLLVFLFHRPLKSLQSLSWFSQPFLAVTELQQGLAFLLFLMGL